MLSAALAWDVTRPAQDQLAARVAVGCIHAYRHTLGPLLAAAGVRCRMTPSCSDYAGTCLGRFGLLEGGRLAVMRVIRCGPWTPAGSHDPPPERDTRPRNPTPAREVGPEALPTPASLAHRGGSASAEARCP